MKFECINNQFVEISILGYECPLRKDSDRWEKNWLSVQFNVKDNKKNWNKTDPVITTFELQRLIDWLNTISENKAYKRTLSSGQVMEFKTIDFTERNLSFELINDFDSNIKQIKIIFRGEIKPINDTGTEFSKEFCFKEELDPIIEEAEYSIELNATNDQLKKYSEELEIELSKYPER